VIRAPVSTRGFALLAAGLAVAAAVSIGGHPGAGVTLLEVIEGMALAALAGVALPLFGFFRVGQAFRDRRRRAFVIWGIAQLPLLIYLFAIVVWSADLAQCGPDAYECPL
jgi:hypothetical protein